VPFTLSHPAVVLPLLRYGLPASALVIGTMTPDVPYYLPFPELGSLTHTFLGLPIDVLFGLAMFAGWHAIVASALIDLAPPFVRQRLGTYRPLSLRQHLGTLSGFAGTVAALAIGTLTHIVWDWFTHSGTVVTDNVAWLNVRNGIPRHEWAQYLSSVLGLAVIVWWSVKWWRRQHEPASSRLEPQTRRIAWFAIAAGILLGTVYGVNVAVAEPDPIRMSLFYGATGGIRGGLVVLLAVALGLRLRGLRRTVPAAAQWSPVREPAGERG
jgi:hypothetical protein